MPTTSDDRRARWVNSDWEAIKYLKSQGYMLTEDWYWQRPFIGQEPTEREIDAMIYLIEEWDFGGLLPDNVALMTRWAYVVMIAILVALALLGVAVDLKWYKWLDYAAS